MSDEQTATFFFGPSNDTGYEPSSLTEPDEHGDDEHVAGLRPAAKSGATGGRRRPRVNVLVAGNATGSSRSSFVAPLGVGAGTGVGLDDVVVKEDSVLGLSNEEDLNPTALSSVVVGQKLAMNYVWAEMKRNKRSFMIGLFTVFLVVCFVSLLYNSVLKSPIVFFRLAEASVGENDLIFTPPMQIDGSVVATGTVDGIPAINHTLVNATQEGVGSVTGTTPRWLLIAEVVNPSDADRAATAGVLVIDSDQEKAIGLGREWDRPRLGTGEAYISSSVLRQVGLVPKEVVGSNVDVRLDFIELANTLDLVDLDENGEVSEEDGKELLFALFPGVEDRWDEEVQFDLLENDFFNLTAIEIGEVNVTQLVDSVVDVLDALFPNVTLPDGLRNLTRNLTDTLRNTTLTANQTAEFVELLEEFILDTVFGNASTVVDTTVGELVEAVLPTILSNLVITQSVLVRDYVSSPNGKWSSAIGNVVVLESDSFWDQTRDALLSAFDVTVNGTLARLLLEELGLNTNLTQIPGLSDTIIEQLEEVIRGEDALFNSSNSELDEALRSARLEDYALQSILMYTDRVDAYLSDVDDMKDHMIDFTNDVARRYGVKRITHFDTPISNTLEQTVWIRLFLDNIFFAVISVIVLLGILLIYSLLLNDVEEKTYEYGMLRALGMRHRTLVQILLTKSFIFASLGIGLGLLVSYLCNIPISQDIAEFAAIEPRYTFYMQAILLAVVIGLVMPLVANIAPISRALSRTLRDSLDIYHHVISDITVRVIKLANLGLSLWQTALAVLLVVVGFVTFYLIPYSFRFRNFALFLGLLTAILLGMLVGLCIIAQAIQPYLEKGMLWCLLWGSHRRLHNVVRKNLSGHGKRNRKTSLMFTLALAFLLFAATMFALQSRSLEDNVRVFWGADLLVIATETDDRLREAEMRDFLDQEIARKGGVVEGYTFVTFPLYANSVVDWTEFSNLPNFPSLGQAVWGIQRNYLDVAYSQYYMPSQTDDAPNYPETRHGDPDALKAMFTDAGNARLPEERNGLITPKSIGSGTISHLSADTALAQLEEERQERTRIADSGYRNYIDVVVSEALREFASVSTDTPLDLRVEREDLSGYEDSRHYLCKARGLARKVPGFFFSSYRQTAWFSSILIREDQYAEIMAQAYEFANTTGPTAPKQKLLVRVRGGASSKQRNDVFNGLRLFFRSDKTFTVDTLKVIQSAQESIDMLQLFFTIVGVLAIIMCFFILWLSFSANVMENAWEFGVLRSLGLNSFETVMVYVYEALALVLSSVILGAVIGVLIAISLTLQFILFTEMPFRFDFPYQVFFVMFGMSLVVSIVSSVLPTVALIRKPISAILKRQ